MDRNYFESLQNSIQEPNQMNSSAQFDTAFLTVKVDIGCKLYCDGDFLDLLEANKAKKVKILTGQHLMTIESEQIEDVSEDLVVDAQESGKNYLLTCTLKEKEQQALEELGRIKKEEDEHESSLAEKDSIISSLEDEIEKLKSTHKKEMDQLMSEKDFLLSESDKRIDSLEQEKNRLNKQLQSEKQNSAALQASLDSAMRPIQEQIYRALEKESENKANEIGTIKLNHQEEVDGLQKQINELKSEHQKEVVDIRIQCQNEIDEIKNNHQKEISDIRTKHRNKIDEIRENHQSEKVKLIEQVRSEAETFKSEIEEGVQKLKSRIKQLESIIEQKDDEIKQLQSKQSKGLFGLFK